MISQNPGVFMGRTLLQQSGQIGGKKYVFVKMQGDKNELVHPPLGCLLLNPFKNGGKFFAGDLVEYRTDGTGIILKSFSVVKAAAATDTAIRVLKTAFTHKPCVGDILMKAPTTLTATGTGIAVTSVTTSTEVVAGNTVDCYVLTVSASGVLAVGDILVEADKAGAGASMLCKNPNMQLAYDLDCVYDANTDTNDLTTGAKYLFSPILGKLAYTDRMSAIPACVLALNKSRVDGWFLI